MSDDMSRATVSRGMIDSHFHSIETQNKGLDASAILRWCFENGLRWAVDVSVSLEDFPQRRKLTARFPQISFTAGMYPSEAQRFATSGQIADKMIRALEAQLDDERVVAVGEIGVDCLRDYAPLDLQLELFRSQLALAAARDLPVVVHNRGCDDLVIAALETAHLERAGVMHCFSSDYRAARRFLDLGFAVSFAGNVTFKNSALLQDVAMRLPDDALLVETDAPYLAPVPVRGRLNHPGYVGHTYGFLAQLRRQPLERLVEYVAVNFARVFGIDTEGVRD